MRKQKRMPAIFLIIFVIAFILSFVGVMVIPIPEELKKPVFFLAVPGISGVGITVASHFMKK